MIIVMLCAHFFSLMFISIVSVNKLQLKEHQEQNCIFHWLINEKKKTTDSQSAWTCLALNLFAPECGKCMFFNKLNQITYDHNVFTNSFHFLLNEFFQSIFFPLPNQWVLSNKTSIRNGEKRWKIKSKSNWLKSDIYFFYRRKCIRNQVHSHATLRTVVFISANSIPITFWCVFIDIFILLFFVLLKHIDSIFFLVPFFRALFEHEKKSAKEKKAKHRNETIYSIPRIRFVELNHSNRKKNYCTQAVYNSFCLLFSIHALLP